MASLQAQWHAWRESRALQRRPIPDGLWRETLTQFPFLKRGATDDALLRRLTRLFLDQKEFSGADGLVVTDAMAVAIAAQACLPVLNLGLQHYEGFVGIVVHADQVSAQRVVMDDDGVVHEYEETLSGEALEGGPVMLSWADVQDAADQDVGAYNVVIHEFAHVLDMANGGANGVPPLPPGISRKQWLNTLEGAFETHCEHVARGIETQLDPYGAQGIEEFFAVASESFFVSPGALAQEWQALYRLLSNYFQQDPIHDTLA